MFRVVDQQDDVILGLDIQPAIEISVAGIPTEFPEEERQTEDVQEDEVLTAERAAPWAVADRISAPELEILQQEIEALQSTENCLR